MIKNLKYVPVLRGRQQEVIVLKSFDFGDRIFPCLEIIKELDRLPPKTSKKVKKNPKKTEKPKKEKKFEDVYIPLISNIKAEKVFVDLPVHLQPSKGMKGDTLVFLRTVVTKREKRTEYMKKLIPVANKVIPVISTYANISGERNTLVLQERDLRPHFPVLAFRTSPKNALSDIAQIEKIVRREDFLIMDWQDMELDPADGDQQDIIDRLKMLKCTIIIHRNAITAKITNVGLQHGRAIPEIDNSLIEKYEIFKGTCFSDYSGIKKDEIGEGGTISPGFTYYDAIENRFYGFKGVIKEIDTYETIIVPAVVISGASRRMRMAALDFLGTDNKGWTIIRDIERGAESGKSPAKFKRIGMEHYLYCLKTKIENGDFD